MDLSIFLLARITEDEDVARAAVAERARMHWRLGMGPKAPDMGFAADVDAFEPRVAVGAEWVLAECAAKRAIVKEHADAAEHDDDPDFDMPAWCARCHGDPHYEVMAWPCGTLRALAQVYADYPDYDEGWRL